MSEKNKTATAVQAPRSIPKTNSQLFEYIRDQYFKAHPKEVGQPVEPHKMAEWACEKGIYNKPALTMAERLSQELSKWLGAERFTDPQGRDVKANHAITVEVQTPHGPKKISRWLPLFDAPPLHIKTSFQQRRRSLFGDARQLHLDWESYNDNNKFNAKLPPMNFNLDEDIRESKFPTAYPTEAPENFDGDDEV